MKSERNTHAPQHTAAVLGTSITSPLDLQIASPATGRLLVLVPADSEYGLAVSRIWQLASTTGRGVYLLGLCKDKTQELSLRRQLIAMSALLDDGRVSTEAKIEYGTRWIGAVRRNYQMGDIIVCFAEQRNGLPHKPLKQVLESNIDAPIFIFSDLYPQRSTGRNVFSQLLLWAGLLGILAGAFLLQTRIMTLPRDWTQTSLMLLSVFGEFWGIWAWNNLFG